ncbi:alpha/beta hydrolase [Streptomyces bambusae]|uniref:alpha/beta hydrolase n=1 Tax=Streptomyces bambusae TaxID=1550616 RepID=UPI001CFF2CCC|nr:alpha/beta hydrolase [Streptomyces bambusae]MCB5165452.1 alpha/beta hydrolase [Streptomyces bambusae]
MRMRRIASLLAVGLTATLVPGLAPAQAAPAPTAADGYLRQTPTWKRCDRQAPAEFQCATIKVPLDYRKPSGRKIDVAISRIKSTSPKRHGVLLFNPGGPGGSGLTMPLMGLEMLPKKVRESYDLIGFDPRGVGLSTPVTCGLTREDSRLPRVYKKETFQKDVAWAKRVAAKCEAKSGDLLPHITTRNTARDMDVIRGVLGERKISYLGYSYGTYLGAVYTQLFPARTDRFVLDSSVDPKRVWRGMIQVWAEGAEPAFDRWTRWSAARDGQYHLGSTPAAVRKTFWDLVKRANKTPIVIGEEKINGDDIRSARGVFFSVKDASEFVVALKEAAAGRPATLPAPRETAGPAKGAAFAGVPADNGEAAFLAVICTDTRNWPRDPAQYRRDALRDKVRYPLYGDFGSNIMPCAYWKKGIEPATEVANKVGVLAVQNEWDSQTPLVSGLGLHRAMKGSRMVTVDEGEGHGVYLFARNTCADSSVNSYLLTGRLPARNVTCKAAPTADRMELPQSGPSRFPVPAGRF